MKTKLEKKIMAVVVTAVITFSAVAQNAPAPAPAVATPQAVAIFPFSERGESVKSQGVVVSDLLFVGLTANPNIFLYERQELQKIADESEISLSNQNVTQEQAIQTGKILGAKIIVTGSVFKVGNDTYIVAKVIGTETSRVLGESVNGKDTIDVLAKELSKKVTTILEKNINQLVPKFRERKDLIADLGKIIGSAKKPKLFVKIDERHVGQATIDPAAETEIQLICKELGFEVTESEKDADLVIKGEGFSEFAARHGNLISIKARLEVKVVDKDGKIVAVDRQTSVEIDLAEQVAGKKALQEAAAKIAERIIPKIVKNK